MPFSSEATVTPSALDRLVHELSDVRLLDILAWKGRRNAQI
jgi:hypothetical protein